jgi:hypothetical protein
LLEEKLKRYFFFSDEVPNQAIVLTGDFDVTNGFTFFSKYKGWALNYFVIGFTWT